MTRFPPVVDPAAVAVEFQANPGEWTQWPRCDNAAVDWPFVVEAGIPNLFGDRERLALCRMVLAYGVDGRLRTIFRRDVGEWSRFDLAEEHVGMAVCHPSVRFAFANKTDRLSFVAALQRIAQATWKKDRPRVADAVALGMALNRMAAPPVEIDVGLAGDSSTPAFGTPPKNKP